MNAYIIRPMSEATEQEIIDAGVQFILDEEFVTDPWNIPYRWDETNFKQTLEDTAKLVERLYPSPSAALQHLTTEEET